MVPVFLCLILSFLSLVQATTIAIDDIVDGKLSLNNLRAVETGNTTFNLGKGFISPIAFEGAVAIGLDSLQRAGTCTMEFGDNTIKYSYKIGQAIHAVYFGKLTSPYGEGSGYYRARSNTLSYGYTVSYGMKCEVRVDELTIGLDNVEMCVGSNCVKNDKEGGFQAFVVQKLIPGMNKRLSEYTNKVEDSLNRVYCMTNAPFDSPEQIGKGLYVLNESLLY